MKMRKGFTLIELLIVLAIIAALMAVVTPIALNAIKKAKATQVAENLRNIKAAVESYFYVETDTTPTSINDLKSRSYLNQDFDITNYQLNGTDLTNGRYFYEVVYTGSDVDGTLVNDTYSEATSTATGVFVQFELQAW